ncbi:hypothetical protein AQ505_18760 [Pedobacter sp. PACM 27299]|uniref:hypothetical protein n=1 Tax=Pedobacter sp. PACM 27299 TaxID=1727164 RepID=UPI000706D011|nr:hypothetical protein [Pedobacter sp. PACM 27299]ALL07349.1 hypothetical protein AQ505_18760 [Pedobacter sp. PACM 27299]
MEINGLNVLLFKTNIRTESDKQFMIQLMQQNEINQWSVDQEDVDCVLRIVSNELQLNDVIALVSQHGYHCEELI